MIEFVNLSHDMFRLSCIRDFTSTEQVNFELKFLDHLRDNLGKQSFSMDL